VILLSLLRITGFGTYSDFYPSAIERPGEFVAGDFIDTDFRVNAYSEESPLMEGGVETKLVEPLVFEAALPDDFDGTPGVRRINAELSNINISKIPAPRQLLGVAATGELWEVESHTLMETQSGIITEINCGPEVMSLTIEENVAAPLQQLVPKRLVRDIFPSADFSGLQTNGDPCVIIPWGRMDKVPLPLIQRPYIHVEFQMISIGGDSFYYLQMDNIPTYVVQPGDVLQYDVIWNLAGSQVGFDVATAGGITLRASGTTDQNGISSHPNANLDGVAVGKWYRREISLNALAGQTLFYYTLGCECDTTRACSANFSNMQIVSSQGELQLTIFNELTTLSLSTLVSNPIGNVAGAFKSDTYHYGPIRSTGLTLSAVYRGNAVADPADYALDVPVPGLLSIRFDAPQRDTNGEPAVMSATFSSSEFQNNAALVKYFLLTDATDGCGVSGDPPSFGAAAYTLSQAGIFVEGGLSSQRPAIDVIGDLNFRGSFLGINAAGAYTDTTDYLELHNAGSVHPGEGDGAWENASYAPASFRLLDQLKQLTIKAFLVNDFGGNQTYAVSSSRGPLANGSIVTRESPYLGTTSVDREVDYLFRKNQIGALYRAEFSAKSFELLSVKVNDLVILHTANDPDLHGRTMLVVRRVVSADSLTFGVKGYDASIYTYARQPVQSSGIPPLVDFRFTLPPTPPGFTVLSSVPQVTADGSIKTFVTLEADAPTQNVSELKFRAIPVGSVLAIEIPAAVSLGQLNVQVTFVLEPGLTYHYEVYGYNGANAPDFRFGVPAQILSQVVPGDVTAPAAATVVLVRQSGTKTIEIAITAILPPDWGTTFLFKNTINDTSTAILIDQGKKVSFHDQNINYATTYFYWVKIADTTGNTSGFSPPGTITTIRLLNDDYTDDSISTGKFQNLSVTNAKIGDLSVTTAKIQDANITNAKIQDLAVTTAKIDNLAVTNAKINDLSAAKINTGMLRVNGVGNGASIIHVDAPSAIEMETDPATPSELIFLDGASVNKAKILGKGTSLSVSPATNNGYALEIGEAGLNWNSIGLRSGNRITLTPGGSNSVFIDGRLGSTDVQSTPPPGGVVGSANRRIPVYNSVGTIVCYLWASI